MSFEKRNRLKGLKVKKVLKLRKPPKDHLIIFRVTKQERDIIKKMAKNKNMTMSNFFIDLLKQEEEKMETIQTHPLNNWESRTKLGYIGYNA